MSVDSRSLVFVTGKAEISWTVPGKPSCSELQFGVQALKMRHMNMRVTGQSTDEEFVQAIAEGSRQAESDLVIKYQRQLIVFCCSRTDQTRGRDIAQMVWVKILPHFRSGKYNGRNVMALLCQTARNLIMDDRKRAESRNSSLDNSPLEAESARTSTPLVELLQAEELDAFTDCKRRLSGEMQKVLERNEEVSGAGDMSKSKIYKLRHYAIKKLRDCVRGKLERGDQ